MSTSALAFTAMSPDAENLSEDYASMARLSAACQRMEPDQWVSPGVHRVVTLAREKVSFSCCSPLSGVPAPSGLRGVRAAAYADAQRRTVAIFPPSVLNAPGNHVRQARLGVDPHNGKFISTVPASGRRVP